MHLAIKSEYYSIIFRGSTLAWINYFLTNRTQQVVLRGIASGTADVTSGVPHGSVLGPLMFFIFINDLPQCLSSKIRLFADDAILYLEVASVDDCQVLQSDLNKLTEWEEKWLMSFDPSKCEVPVLTVTCKKQPTLFNYSMPDQNLNRLKSTKYLAAINSDLNWNKHIICRNRSYSLSEAIYSPQPERIHCLFPPTDIILNHLHIHISQEQYQSGTLYQTLYSLIAKYVCSFPSQSC